MTTLEIFNAVCDRYDSKLRRFQNDVIYGDGSYQWFGDDAIHSCENILKRTLEDLVQREISGRANRRQQITNKSTGLDSSFLGVAGKL